MTGPIRQPIPIKKKLQSTSFSHSPRTSSPLVVSSSVGDNSSSRVAREPISQQETEVDDSNYSRVEYDRAVSYGLDLPAQDQDARSLLTLLNQKSFAKESLEQPDLHKSLPYSIESLHDKARYLSHIISHLYIAIESLDLLGVLSINASDLEAAKLLLQAGELDKSNFHDSAVDEQAFYDENSSDESSEEDSDDEEMITGKSTPVNKMPSISAAVINARHWSIELKTLIQMEFPIPILIRSSLVKVYYAINLSQGQGLTSDIFIQVFQKLVQDGQLLRDYGLELDWKMAYKICERSFPHENSQFDSYEKDQFRRLLNICFLANPFFDKKAVSQIFSEIMVHFSSSNGSLALSCLYGLLPMNFEKVTVVDGRPKYSSDDVRYYIPSLIHVWSSVTKSESIDLHLVALFSRIAEFSLVEASDSKNSDKVWFGDFGIFEESQFSMLMENLFVSLNTAAMKPSRNGSSFYQSYANLVAFSVIGNSNHNEKSTLAVLGSMLYALRSFVHPSNTGNWTSPIRDLVRSLLSQYHKRRQFESGDEVNTLENSDLQYLSKDYKLNIDTDKTFVRILLPLIRTGMQSKSDAVVNNNISALSLLCYINPKIVLDSVLIDCYSSLETVTSSHRLRVVLKELAVIMRYMVSMPVYRVHTMRLLTAILPGIDSNDLVKSLQTFHLIAVTSSLIPFTDLSTQSKELFLDSSYDFTQQHIQYLEDQFYNNDNIDDREPFVYEEEYERGSLISSTSYLKDFLKVFCERLFLLLENIPDPQKTSGLESKIVLFIPKTFAVLVESLSDDCFEYLADLVFTFVSDKVLYTISDCVGGILSVLTRRDPKTQFPRFLNLLINGIKEEIKNNGAGSFRGENEVLPRDQPLFWYTIILSSIVSHVGEVLLKYRSELEDIISLLTTSVKGPVAMITSLIQYHLLTTTTTTWLRESRFISPQTTEKIDEQSWGGFQFDAKRFESETLTYDWHVPTNDEISFAISVFDTQTKLLMADMESLMTSKEDLESSKDLLLTDKLGTDLLALGNCVAGVSHLFDPTYKELSDDASKPLVLKRKLSSLEFFRKKYGSFDSLSRASPIVSTPDISNSASSTAIEMENDSEVATSDGQERSEDYVDANLMDEDVIMDDDSSFVGEIPISTKLTPSPSHGGQDDLNESLNALLSFKDRKLYHSNYYFGEKKIEKLFNDDYTKIHELRDSIGRFLHRFYRFLVDKGGDNTKLFKILIQTLKIWMCDVGSEVVLNLNGSATLKFEYIDSFQFIRRIKKPYTRIGFGLLLEKLHKQRVSLFSGSRMLTPVDKLLLSDVVQLSTSSYAGIASTAIASLNSSMKILLGSYGLSIRQLITILLKAISEGDEKVVQHSLSVFNSKRFKTKIPYDFKNLPAIVSLLHDCILMESNVQVAGAASEVYANIVNKIKIPSSVCAINKDYISSIRPPDNYVDTEINAVKLAKEKKRKQYLDQLEDLTQKVLLLTTPSKFWKINYFNLSLIINIQSDLEVSTNTAVLLRLFQFTSDTHPTVFRLCLKGICGILSKIRTLGSFDYDIYSIYTNDHDPQESIDIETSPGKSLDSNFTNNFQQEIRNFENPGFFIDNKSNFSWLFWGDRLKAVRNQFQPELSLREPELQIIQSFGENITKEWVTATSKLLVQELENDGGYHTNDVRLVSLIVNLTSSGMTPLLRNDDWFDIIESTYVADDKDSHLVVCEIMAGLLTANSHTTPEFSQSRDLFVAKILRQILFKDINLETRGIWIVFSWWVPGNSDMRRFPEVSKVLSDFVIDKKSDSSFNDASRLMVTKHFVASTSFRFPFTEQLIEKSFRCFDHPYQLVREQLASLVTAFFIVSFIKPHLDCGEFLKSNEGSATGAPYYDRNDLFHDKLISLFENLKIEKSKSESLPVQSLLKTPYIYTSRTILKFLKNVMITSASSGLAPYLVSHIFPFLFELSELREVCLLAGIMPQRIIVLLAYIPFREEQLEAIVDYVINFDVESTVWHNIQVLELFIQLFYLKHYFVLSVAQKDKLFEFLLSLLYHDQLEVRETAAKILTSIIHVGGGKDVDSWITETLGRFTKLLNKSKKQLSKNKSDEKAIIRLHGATLGLTAILDAFPYVSPIPKWLPMILTTLANKSANMPGTVGKTAKNSLSRFKKNRQDTWHIDSKFFTPDQLQDLEGVLWTSYFV